MSYLNYQYGVPVEKIFARWKQAGPKTVTVSHPVEGGVVTVQSGPVYQMMEFKATWWRRVYRAVSVKLGKDPYPDTDEFRRGEMEPRTGVTLAPGESISLEELLRIQNDPS